MLISFAVTVKLICVFVFAYANSRFSHNEAHLYPLNSYFYAVKVGFTGVYIMFLIFALEYQMLVPVSSGYIMFAIMSTSVGKVFCYKTKLFMFKDDCNSLLLCSKNTHISLASYLRDKGKQNSPRWDAEKLGIPSGAILFAFKNFIKK